MVASYKHFIAGKVVSSCASSLAAEWKTLDCHEILYTSMLIQLPAPPAGPNSQVSLEESPYLGTANSAILEGKCLSKW